MSVIGLALLVIGIVLVAFGLLRARGPYQRYSALREQDANIARYEAWRGGSRPDSKTGASVAMDLLKRQWQTGVVIAIAGVACLAAALVIG